MRSLRYAEPTSPDLQVRALRAAELHNITPEMARRLIEGTSDAESTFYENDVDRTLRGLSATQQWLTNPDNVQLAYDDVEALSHLERALHSGSSRERSFGAELADATGRGFLRYGVVYGNVGAALGALDLDTAGEVTASSNRAMRDSSERSDQDIQLYRQRVGEAEGLGVIPAAFSDLEGFASMTAEQIGMLVGRAAGGLAGGAAGSTLGPIGTTVGAFEGQAIAGVVTEFGLWVNQELERAGYDIYDGKSVSAAYRDHSVMDPIFKEALAKGVLITAFDSLSLLVGGRFISDAAKKGKGYVSATVKEGVTQTVLEGAGEAASLLGVGAVRGELPDRILEESLLESVISLPVSVTEVAYGTWKRRSRSRGGGRPLAEAQEAAQATQDAGTLRSAIEAWNGTKVSQRSPKRLAQLVGGVDQDLTVRFDIEDWDAFWAGKGEVPAEQVPAGVSSYHDARDLGFIEMSVGAFLVDFADDPVAAELIEVASLRDGAPTTTAAAATLKEINSEIESALTEHQDAVEEGQALHATVEAAKQTLDQKTLDLADPSVAVFPLKDLSPKQLEAVAKAVEQAGSDADPSQAPLESILEALPGSIDTQAPGVQEALLAASADPVAFVAELRSRAAAVTQRGAKAEAQVSLDKAQARIDELESDKTAAGKAKREELKLALKVQRELIGAGRPRRQAEWDARFYASSLAVMADRIPGATLEALSKTFPFTAGRQGGGSQTEPVVEKTPWEQAAEEVVAGRSDEQIAAEIGASPENVRKILDRVASDLAGAKGVRTDTIEDTPRVFAENVGEPGLRVLGEEILRRSSEIAVQRRLDERARLRTASGDGDAGGGNVTVPFEVAPGEGAPLAEVLAPLQGLPVEDQIAVTSKIADAVLKASIEIAGSPKVIGAMTLIGGWLNPDTGRVETNATQVVSVDIPVKQALGLASTIAYLGQQTEVWAVGAADAKGPKFIGVEISHPSLGDPATIRAFWEALADVDPDLAGGFTPVIQDDGTPALLSLRGDPAQFGVGLEGEAFASELKRLRSDLGAALELAAEAVDLDGVRVSYHDRSVAIARHQWTEDPSGQSLRRGVEAAFGKEKAGDLDRHQSGIDRLARETIESLDTDGRTYGQPDDARGGGGRGADRGRQTEGSLPGLPRSSPGADPRILRIAERLAARRGEQHRRPALHERADPERGARIADIFESLEHAPDDPEVAAAYDALIEETLEQWHALIEGGFVFEFIPEGVVDPYPRARDALADMRKGHLWVFPTDQGYGSGDDAITDHPMLRPVGINVGGRDLVANDIFRAVHDVFGHGMEGVYFGPSGEETAWQSHIRMFSELAGRALTTETRGQNSWVNFGPLGEQNRADPVNTTYSEQKAALMPAEVSTEGLREDMQVETTLGQAERPGFKSHVMEEIGHRLDGLADQVEAEEISQEDFDAISAFADGEGFGALTQSARAALAEELEDAAGVARDAVEHLHRSDPQVRKARREASDLDAAASDLRKRTLGQPVKKPLRPKGFEVINPHLDKAEKAKLRRDTSQKLYDIFNQLPQESDFEAAALAGRIKKGWYEKSTRAIRAVFGEVDGPRFALLLAAMSPQTSVESNLFNAVNTWVNWVDAGRPVDRPAIIKILGASVQGDKAEKSILDAWINNTVRAFSTDDPLAMTLSGPKVNSFGENLNGRMGEVTSDAWMANFAFIDQVIFSGSLNVAGTDPGKTPGYLAMSAKVRRVAKRLTKSTGEPWSPANVQETVWSWAKTAYELSAKKGESRSVQELVEQGAVTDEALAGTPDFGTLFAEDATIRALLEGAGYGNALKALEAEFDHRASDEGDGAAGAAGQAGSGARTATAAPGLVRSARRLDRLAAKRRAEAANPKPKKRRVSKLFQREVSHGTGAFFEEFDMAFMSTGEGAQMYGWGLYFADRRGIGKSYKEDRTTPPTLTYRGKAIDEWIEALDDAANTRTFQRFASNVPHLLDSSNRPNAVYYGDSEAYVRSFSPVGAAIFEVYNGVRREEYGFIEDSVQEQVDLLARVFKSKEVMYDFNSGAEANAVFSVLSYAIEEETDTLDGVLALIDEAIDDHELLAELTMKDLAHTLEEIQKRVEGSPTRAPTDKVSAALMAQVGRLFTRMAWERKVIQQLYSDSFRADFALTGGSPGYLLTVNLLPDEDEYLLHDKPFSEQSAKVQAALLKLPHADSILAVNPLTAKMLDPRTGGTKSGLPNGGEIYRRLSKKSGSRHYRGDPKAASLALLSVGIQGIKFLDGISRPEYKPLGFNEWLATNPKLTVMDRARIQRSVTSKEYFDATVAYDKFLVEARAEYEATRTFNYVLFDAKMAQIIKREQKRRGSVTIGERDAHGRRAFHVEFYSKANRSTFFHEMGHIWLEMMGDIVEHGLEGVEIPQQVIDDYQGILDFLGAQSRAGITEEMHEKWARSFEAYLREGVAPSSALREMFMTFRKWMEAIYRNLVDLDAPLNDSIREIMDRLVATDEQIKEAQFELGVPLPPRILDTLTDAQRDRYHRRVQRERDEADLRLTREVMKSVAERSRLHRSEFMDKLRDETDAELQKHPAAIAVANMRDGVLPDGSPLQPGVEQVGLDRDAVIDLYGPESDVLAALADMGVLVDEDGLTPSQAAEAFGTTSGDELLRAMVQMADRDAVVEGIVNERFKREAPPELLLGPEIAGMRKRLTATEARSERILEDLRLLKAKAKTDSAIPTLGVIRERAKRALDGKTINEILPHKYQQSSRWWARKAWDRSLAGDFEVAAEAKTRELLNHELYRISLKIRDKARKHEARAKKLIKPKSLGRAGKAGYGYRDHLFGLASRFGFTDKQAPADPRQKPLRAWLVDAEKDTGGLAPDIAEWILDERDRRNWKDLTPEELQDVRDAMDQIYKVATNKNKILDERRKGTIQDEVDAINASLEAWAARTGKSKKGKRLRGDRPGRLRRFLASHRAIDSLAREIDGAVGGAFFRSFIRPKNEAQTDEVSQGVDINKDLKAVFDELSDDDKRLWSERTKISGLGEDLTLEQRFMVAMNYGNKEGRLRLENSFTAKEIQFILNSLEPRHARAAQKAIEAMDKFWPASRKLWEKIKGVAPPKVEAVPFTTTSPSGKKIAWAGGYHRIKYAGVLQLHEATLDQQAQQIKSGASIRSTTKSGSMIERLANVDHELRLDFGVVTSHLAEVVHMNTHLIPLRDMQAVLDGSRKAMVEHLGEEVYDQFRAMYLDLAAGTYAANDTFGEIMKFLRVGQTVMRLGWRITTNLINVSGVSQSFPAVGGEDGSVDGARRVMGQMVKLMRQPARIGEVVAEVHRLSKFMATRSLSFDREIAEQFLEFKKLRPADKLARTPFVPSGAAEAVGVVMEAADRVARSSFIPLGWTQAMVDIPTWLAAFEKATEKGFSESDAVAIADDVVTAGQGSGRIGDMARIMRGSEMHKLFTTFYGYATRTMNLSAELTGRTSFRDPVQVMRWAAEMLMLLGIPALTSMMVQRMIRGDRGDEDETLVEELGYEMLSYTLGMFVGAREFGGLAIGIKDYSGPAGASFFGETYKLAEQINQGVVDDALAKRVLTVAGTLLHMPTTQLNESYRGLKAYLAGEAGILAPIVGAPKGPAR